MEIAVKRIAFVLLTMLLALPAAKIHPASKIFQQDADYSRESRAAIGAHHLCSGLWVVGRVYKRTPIEVLAQDIAPFRAFGWEANFKFEVDEARHRVTVTAPGVPARTAQYNGDQGCSILPRGVNDIYFKPVPVPRNLPD